MAYIYVSCSIGFCLMVLFQLESLGKNVTELKSIINRKDGEF
ncbi:MAG: hypothetical protein ACOX81_06295 [Candidatus Heteroscillospira sp.]